MSHKQAKKQRVELPQLAGSPVRAPFNISIVFNPQQPERVPVSITSSDDTAPRLDDVILALRVCYEQAVFQKGLLVAQQAAQANSHAEGELEHANPV